MALDLSRAAPDLASEFERLARKILINAGYHLDDEFNFASEYNAAWRFDFLATKSPETKRLIDVKWMGLPSTSLRVLGNLGSLYGYQAAPNNRTKITLLVSSDVPSRARRWVLREYGFEVWGREQLRRLASDDDKVELARFFAESDGWFAASYEQPADDRSPRDSELQQQLTQRELEFAFDLSLSSDPNERMLSGADLCKELQRVPAGKAGAKEYEQIIARIFDFLFPSDLIRSPASEQRSDDGMNIYDWVFQIRNRSEFWTNLARDFRARVLIVECKNYVQPIEAMQIYTTERYLSLPALRSVGFVLTRKRPHRRAYQATGGALRESGKLIVMFDDDDVCTMLHMRDEQLRLPADRTEANDPSEIINSRVHRLLAKLPR